MIMSDFANTIEVFGDEEVLKSFISRTITEYKDDIILEVGQSAFSSCYNIKTIDLPNVESMGVGAFKNCTALTYMNIPKLKSVATDGFNGAGFESILIPNATSIGVASFTSCINLKKVDLYNINKISGSSFSNSALEALIIRREDAIPKLNSTSAFDGTPLADGSGYVYVPASMVDSYKEASNWSNFALQIRAIEDYPDICE